MISHIKIFEINTFAPRNTAPNRKNYPLSTIHSQLKSLSLPPEKETFSFLDISHTAQQVASSEARQQGVTITSYIMPKVKTNSSAKKRFKVTGTGKISFQKPFKRHILTKKSTKRKRVMGLDGMVHTTQVRFVKRLLRLRG
jgi:large subunit ribosomal protein L35